MSLNLDGGYHELNLDDRYALSHLIGGFEASTLGDWVPLQYLERQCAASALLAATTGAWKASGAKKEFITPSMGGQCLDRLDVKRVHLLRPVLYFTQQDWAEGVVLPSTRGKLIDNVRLLWRCVPVERYVINGLQYFRVPQIKLQSPSDMFRELQTLHEKVLKLHGFSWMQRYRPENIFQIEVHHTITFLLDNAPNQGEANLFSWIFSWQLATCLIYLISSGSIYGAQALSRGIRRAGGLIDEAGFIQVHTRDAAAMCRSTFVETTQPMSRPDFVAIASIWLLRSMEAGWSFTVEVNRGVAGRLLQSIYGPALGDLERLCNILNITIRTEQQSDIDAPPVARLSAELDQRRPTSIVYLSDEKAIDAATLWGRLPTLHWRALVSLSIGEVPPSLNNAHLLSGPHGTTSGQNSYLIVDPGAWRKIPDKSIRGERTGLGNYLGILFIFVYTNPRK